MLMSLTSRCRPAHRPNHLPYRQGRPAARAMSGVDGSTEIAHRTSIIDARLTEHGEAERGVEGIRDGIGWQAIDLAEDPVMSGSPALRDHVLVQSAAIAATACARRGDDPVDIDEAAIAGAKPEE